AEQLGRPQHAAMIRAKDYEEIAHRAVRVVSRANVLLPFERMALREAIDDRDAARLLAGGLYEWLYGTRPASVRFQEWCHVVEALPRRDTRVPTWPMITAFGFIAQPKHHMLLKANVVRDAARDYGAELLYRTRPFWATYRSVLDFAETIRRDQ